MVNFGGHSLRSASPVRQPPSMGLAGTDSGRASLPGMSGARFTRQPHQAQPRPVTSAQQQQQPPRGLHAADRSSPPPQQPQPVLLPPHAALPASQPPQLAHTFQADLRCVCPAEPGVVWCADKLGRVHARDALTGVELTFNLPVGSGDVSPNTSPARHPLPTAPTTDIFRKAGLLVTCMARIGETGGATVWVGFNDGLVRVFCAQTKALLREVGRHSGGVFAVCAAFGSVFTSGGDWKVLQWCPLTYRQLSQIASPSSSSVKCMLSGEAGHPVLITGAHDGIVRVYAAPDNAHCFELRGHSAAISGLVLIRGVLWTSSDDRTVRVWDLASRACLRVVNEHAPYRITSDIVSLAYGNEDRVSAFLKDGSIVSISRESGAIAGQTRPLEPEGGSKRAERVTSGCLVGHFVGDSSWSCSTDGRVRVHHHPSEHEAAYQLIEENKALAEERLAEIVSLQSQTQSLQGCIRELKGALEKRDCEHYEQVERTLEVQGEVARMRSAQDALQQSLTSNSSTLEQEAEHARRVQETNGALNQKIRELVEANEALAHQVEVLQIGEQEHFTTEMEQKQRFMMKTEDECRARYEEQIESLSRQLAALASENEAVSETLAARETRVIELEENLRMSLSDTGELASLRYTNTEAVNAIAGLEARAVSLADENAALRTKTAQQEEDLAQARKDRDMLSTEVRHLGDLLAEVSSKAKEFQGQNTTQLDALKKDLEWEKNEVEARAADLQARVDALLEEIERLRQELAAREAFAEELKQKQAEAGHTMDEMRRRHEAEVASARGKATALEDELEDTRNRYSRRSGMGLDETARTGLEDGEGVEAAPTYEDLERRVKELEELLAEQEKRAKEAEIELEGLKNGDGATIGLYTQLQHEQVWVLWGGFTHRTCGRRRQKNTHTQVVKNELKRNNDNLCETIEQLKDRVLVLSSANRTLQDENDRLMSDTASQAGDRPGPAVNFASGAPGEQQPSHPPSRHPDATNELGSDIIHRRTLPSELRGGTSTATGILQGASHTTTLPLLPADKMNKELDTIVGYLDNMKHKLDSLETAAENARDPYIREALLQEINALHRQVLDDTLAHKQRATLTSPGSAAGGGGFSGGGSSCLGGVLERKPLDVPASAGGILKLANEKFTEVEKAFGLDDASETHDVLDPFRRGSADGLPLPSHRSDPTHSGGLHAQQFRPPPVQVGTPTTGGGSFPQYNPSSMPGNVRAAYGFTSDVHPSK